MNNISEEKASGLAIAALVTGILSILPIFPGFALGIAAIVCGAIDFKRIKEGKSSIKGRGFDIAGIVLGSIDIVMSVILIAVGTWVSIFARYINF